MPTPGLGPSTLAQGGKVHHELAHLRVLLVDGHVLGGGTGGSEFAQHQAKLGPSQKGVHVGEGGRGHSCCVALSDEEKKESNL